MDVNVVKLRENATLPVYQTEGSAGMDIHACLTGPIPLPVGLVVKVPTGLAMEIPLGWEGQVRSRSGLAFEGLVVANAPGTIDADYRGEILVMITNRADRVQWIHPGERIAQIVFAQVAQAKLHVVEKLSKTDRGEGGFGSTGV